ncbi:MAG: phosphoglycolate phosphatase [Thermoproteota archaeon]|nr:phosphoglycolate phosphatase [Thermoproteota archaeon]MDQ4101971.1 phosphoglycolate phosphatase [Thermoproteota archaeon]
MAAALKVFAVDIDGTLTENGGGMVHLAALAKLRYLEKMGYNVIYVTGRSSIEAYVLAVFGGTTRIAVGENGGVITIAPQEHRLLASREKCMQGYEILKKNLDGVKMKPVFPRMSEVVLLRTFDIKEGQKILDEYHLTLYLSDSKYAFHINEKGINKAYGLKEALSVLKVEPDQVVAIGDSETDIPMYDICGCSIALDHADDNVKAQADHVVAGREGAGLVEAIDFVAFKYLGVKA